MSRTATTTRKPGQGVTVALKSSLLLLLLRLDLEGALVLLLHRHVVRLLELDLLGAGEGDLAPAALTPARPRLPERRIRVLSRRVRELVRPQLRVEPPGS